MRKSPSRCYSLLYRGNHFGGIFASKHIFASVVESNKEAIARLAVIGEVATQVALVHSSPVPHETTASTQSTLRHCGLAKPCIGDISQWYHLASQWTLHTQRVAVNRDCERCVEKSRQAEQQHNNHRSNPCCKDLIGVGKHHKQHSCKYCYRQDCYYHRIGAKIDTFSHNSLNFLRNY